MKRLVVDIQRCSGCKRCELACIKEHSYNTEGISNLFINSTQNPRIFVESINDRPVPVICRHCKEPLCVSACMAGCMQKDEKTGIVNNQGHIQKCVGCWMCIMACPFGVILPSFSENDIDKHLFPQAIKCDFCPDREIPACVEACPNEVLSVEEYND